MTARTSRAVGAEGAIAGAIAWKYDGTNSQAGEFFCRMIQLPEPQERDETY